MKSNMKVMMSMGALCFGAVTTFGQIAAIPVAPPTPEPAPDAVPAAAEVPALPAPPGTPAQPGDIMQFGYANDFSGDVLFGGAGGPNRTLAILKDAAEVKDVGEIEEDLNVMARILDKAVSDREDRMRNAMGIVIHSNIHGPGMAPRNLYLEGYGAVFFLNVNYPLLEPGNKKDEQSKEDTNSEWEQARRELAQPGPHNFGLALPQVAPFADGPAEEYDSEKVEKLKTDLISALKNAAHIRRLKPDEVVTVVVTGRGSGVESRVVSKRTGRGHATVAVYGQGNVESSGARLVLRVRKSDVEAFQKEKTSLEDFRKKVTMLTY